MVHGVRREAIKISDIKQAVTNIYKENDRLHTNLDFVHLSWSKKAIREEKRYSSLIIDTASPDIANAVIQSGLLVEGELKTCERYKREAKITQCLQCHHYGHIGKACNRPQSCGTCAQPHVTAACPTKTMSQHKCTVCGGRHAAWSRQCATRRAEYEKSAYIRASIPDLYSSSLGPNIHTTTPTESSSQTSASGGVVSWEIVKSRNRGRPSFVDLASQDPSQTRLDLGLKKRKRAGSNPLPQATNEDEQIMSSAPQPEEEEEEEY